MGKSTRKDNKLSIPDHARLKHEERHRDGDIFACKFCGRVFNKEKNLSHHIKERHRHVAKTVTKSEREKKPFISEHARVMRIVNPEYMEQKRKAWTEAYRDERDLNIRCGKYTFLVHGVFMSQVSTFFAPGKEKHIKLDQFSPETIEAVLLLSYGDAVIVRSAGEAGRVHEAVEHIGLTACIETRKLTELRDREKDVLASDMHRAKRFQKDMVSGKFDGISRLTDDFLRSRPPPVPEKSRLPPKLLSIRIRITDPKLLHDLKDREGGGATPKKILQRMMPTMGARKCYDTLPSYTSPGKIEVFPVAKVEGISPPGKSDVLRKIFRPVSERMETDYKEALKKENDAAKFVEFSPEGSKKSAAAEEQSGGENSVNAGPDSYLATRHEDSGISSRPTSPECDDSVEEEPLEVIDERTHVLYNTRTGENCELTAYNKIAAAKESDVAANEKSKDTENVKRKEKTAADSKLNKDKSRKRKSTDNIQAPKKQVNHNRTT